MRPVVWKEDKRFLEMDPMNARFWSHEDQRPNWTIWDEIHRGNLPLLATTIYALLMLRFIMMNRILDTVISIS